jgi:membrane protein implicated in regulation of membrane protease activity
VVNGFTLTAFLCWFGGAGYLMERYGGLVTPVILGFATLTGLAGGSLIFLFLAKVLAPHDRPLTAEDTEMTGVIGRVSGTIRPDGIGEILYSQNGSRRSSPARSDTGEPIARDMEVVVMRYERGIAYVRRWDELSSGSSQT